MNLPDRFHSVLKEILDVLLGSRMRLVLEGVHILEILHVMACLLGYLVLKLLQSDQTVLIALLQTDEVLMRERVSVPDLPHYVMGDVGQPLPVLFRCMQEGTESQSVTIEQSLPHFLVFRHLVYDSRNAITVHQPVLALPKQVGNILVAHAKIYAHRAEERLDGRLDPAPYARTIHASLRHTCQVFLGSYTHVSTIIANSGLRDPLSCRLVNSPIYHVHHVIEPLPKQSSQPIVTDHLMKDCGLYIADGFMVAHDNRNLLGSPVEETLRLAFLARQRRSILHDLNLNTKRATHVLGLFTHPLTVCGIRYRAFALSVQDRLAPVVRLYERNTQLLQLSPKRGSDHV